MQASTALRRSFIRLAGAGALAAALSAPAFAEKTTTLKIKIGVAFSETIGPTTDGKCPALEGNINGAGYSTDLGAVSVRSTDCFMPTDATLTNFAFATKPGTMVTLTTANGDTLTGTYSGTATGQPFPIEALSGTVMFSGGTGRYAKATGTATLEGIENIGTVPATGVLVISGKITY